MSRVKIILPAARLKRLYLLRYFSTLKIADIFGCSSVTVASRLRECGIKLRDKAHMHERYKKSLFSGGMQEKAYLLGFRLGDLNVYKPYKNSDIFVVRCHTTVRCQVDLIRSLFLKYGGVKIANSMANGFTINCFLDRSFRFLFTKNLPRWVFEDQLTAIQFIAGYVDAEGSFGLNQGRGRFQMSSYDYNILRNINSFLRNKNIRIKFRMIARKNMIRPEGGRWNNNLWRFNINDAQSLEKFIGLIMPYLKHRKRIQDAIKVLNNIKGRRINGSIK